MFPPPGCYLPSPSVRASERVRGCVCLCLSAGAISAPTPVLLWLQEKRQERARSVCIQEVESANWNPESPTPTPGLAPPTTIHTGLEVPGMPAGPKGAQRTSKRRAILGALGSYCSRCGPTSSNSSISRKLVRDGASQAPARPRPLQNQNPEPHTV